MKTNDELIKQEIQVCVMKLYAVELCDKDFDVWYDKVRGVYTTNVAFKLSKLGQM